MLKRTRDINVFISLMLAGSAAVLLALAIEKSDFYYGIHAVGTVIAFVLNILCGDGTSQQNRN